MVMRSLCSRVNPIYLQYFFHFCVLLFLGYFFDEILNLFIIMNIDGKTNYLR